MTTIAVPPSGTLSPGHAPKLVLTASALVEGVPLVLREAANPPNPKQLWIVTDGRIKLAANPNLIVGPSSSSDGDAVLFDTTKSTNSTNRDLILSGIESGFPYTLDGASFTNVGLFSTGKRVLLDVRDKASTDGASVIFYKQVPGATNQLWTYTVLPPQIPRIVLYDFENFQGASVEITSAVSDLSQNNNFYNKTNSIYVKSGKWLLYYSTNYPSDVNNFWVVSSTGGANGDGRYALPSTWGDWAGGNRIGAIRPLPNTGIVLYENQWFSGRCTEIQQDTIDTTDTGLFNSVSSIVVVTGTWRVFYEKNYGGTSNLVFPTGGLYQSGFYPQMYQWGGQDNYVNSLRREG